jgi:hypothetical protein
MKLFVSTFQGDPRSTSSMIPASVEWFFVVGTETSSNGRNNFRIIKARDPPHELEGQARHMATIKHCPLLSLAQAHFSFCTKVADDTPVGASNLLHSTKRPRINESRHGSPWPACSRPNRHVCRAKAWIWLASGVPPTHARIEITRGELRRRNPAGLS